MDKRLAQEINQIRRSLKRAGIEILEDTASVHDRLLLAAFEKAPDPMMESPSSACWWAIASLGTIYPAIEEFADLDPREQEAWLQLVNERALHLHKEATDVVRSMNGRHQRVRSPAARNRTIRRLAGGGAEVVDPDDDHDEPYRYV